MSPDALVPPSSVGTAPRLGLLPATVRGVLAAGLLVLNTLAWCGVLFAAACVKLLLPFRLVRVRVDPILNAIATGWISCNSGWMRLTQRTRWDVSGFDGLTRDGWYMVTCNHQSWVDILVLQHLLNRRIPLLKFFLKRQLIYVPVIGLAWWALDFPFMRRHSSAQLKSDPGKRYDDIDATRRACAKFSLVPTSVMNFAEGTRFTPAKHRMQHSPYRHLLKPKAGAMASALNVLGDRFRSVLDVTIVYPGGAPTFWQFLCGKVETITVRAREVAIPADIRAGDYERDPRFRRTIQRWLGQLWHEKDREIGLLLRQDVPSPAA